MFQWPSITVLDLSRRGFLYLDYVRASGVLLWVNLFDTTSARTAQDLAIVLGTGAGFCILTMSRDKTHLLAGGGRPGALPMATPGEWITVYSHKSSDAIPSADQSTSPPNLE